MSSIRHGLGDESTGHRKARKAFKSSSSNKRAWTLLHAVGKQPYWSQPLYGIRGIKCYCINRQHWLFLLSACQIPLFRCAEKSRSVTSAGRRLQCRWCCHFNIHLFITKSESPGSSTCGTASIHSFLRGDRHGAGPEQNAAKQKRSKGPAHLLFIKKRALPKRQQAGRGARDTIQSSSGEGRRWENREKSTDWLANKPRRTAAVSQDSSPKPDTADFALQR